MMSQMDERFAAALREVLVEQVESLGGQARLGGRRSRRSTAAVSALLALVAGGGGIAYATGIFSTVPGADRVAVLAEPVTTTATGTQTVQLGARPAAATSVAISFTCLTGGDFTFADGAAVHCDSAGGSPATYTLKLGPGERSTTITATTGARWRLVATYAKVTTTRWGVNARGQTYGTPNQHGTPDLIATIATNGRRGYVYAKQLMWGAAGTPPTSPAQVLAENGRSNTVTVYQSDGLTPIGKFISGG